MTLEEARALECNGCGDCCDSRRSDGHWAWGGVPEDLYSSIAGEALIIPLEQVGDSWRDRSRQPEDGMELLPTFFRCTAFRPQEDGSGLCGRHNEARPDVCGEFPVWRPGLDREVEEQGEVSLGTEFLPRCTWHNVRVVREGDSRLEQAG
jgi:Fe-S-cluster containining protein